MNLTSKYLDKIKELAISELENPKMDWTKRFLRSFEIEKKETKPVIARIDTDDYIHGRVGVYIPVKEERFFLALYFEVFEQIELVEVITAPGTHVYLWVYDSPKISKSDFPYQPINVEDIRNKQFTFSVDSGEPDELEDKIDKLLDKLESKKEQFLQFSQVTHMLIKVVYHGYKNQMRGHVYSRKTLRRTVELNVGFALDLYVSGVDLVE